MSARTFLFRLRSSHHTAGPGPEAASDTLSVDVQNAEGQWEPQHPDLTTPGFRLYLLSLLLCQHFYLVANAREMGVPLEEVTGTFRVTTSEDWILQEVRGEFMLRLQDGDEAHQQSATDPSTLATIQQRMKLCPVSRNLPEGVRKDTVLRLSPPVAA